MLKITSSKLLSLMPRIHASLRSMPSRERVAVAKTKFNGEADTPLPALVAGEEVFVTYDVHFMGAHFCTT